MGRRRRHKAADTVNFMKRAVFYGNEVIRVEEAPEPQVRPGFAKMKVAYCAVCGSEANLFYKPRFVSNLPHHVFGEMGPFALGHECAGVITEVGEGVTNIKPGDRVAVQPIVSCGECEYCRNGEGNLCAKGYGLLGSVCDGGMAEYICIPAVNYYPIPDDMPLESAALVQCGAVSFGSVMDSGIRAGETALVIGVGTIGLMAVQACKVAGARTIIACDMDADKLAYAKELGVDRTVNIKEENIRDVVNKLTGGRGVDFVYECAGAESSMDDAANCVRKKGTIMILSVFYGNVPLPGLPFLQREIVVKTAVSPFTHNYDYMIELAYKKKMTSEKLITNHVDLNGIADGIRKLKEPGQMKVMVNVDPSL